MSSWGKKSLLLPVPLLLCSSDSTSPSRQNSCHYQLWHHSRVVDSKSTFLKMSFLHKIEENRKLQLTDHFIFNFRYLLRACTVNWQCFLTYTTYFLPCRMAIASHRNLNNPTIMSLRVYSMTFSFFGFWNAKEWVDLLTAEGLANEANKAKHYLQRVASAFTCCLANISISHCIFNILGSCSKEGLHIKWVISGGSHRETTYTCRQLISVYLYIIVSLCFRWRNAFSLCFVFSIFTVECKLHLTTEKCIIII